MVWSIKIAAVLLSLVICRIRLQTRSSVVNDRCEMLLTHGRWQENTETSEWQPFGSLKASWSARSISSCLHDERLLFVGDSITRELLWATARKVNHTAAVELAASIDRHQSFSFHVQDVFLQFLWDPFVRLNFSISHEGLHYHHDTKQGNPVIWSTGLWQTRYHGESYLKSIEEALTEIETVSSNLSKFAILIPPPAMQASRFDAERALSLTTQRVSYVDSLLAAAARHSNNLKPAWALKVMSYRSGETAITDGLHASHEVVDQQADVLLSYICNHIFSNTNKASSYACSADDVQDSPATALASLGIVLMCLAAYQASEFDIHDHVAAMFAILAYCFIGDRTSTLSKSNKLVSQPSFLLLTSTFLLLLMVPKHIQRLRPSSSLRQSTSTSLLCRDSTDEIKGWMQVIILYYHYYGMSATLWVYKCVRVLVAAYLFLLGYGHTRYFRESQDFSFRRFVSVLLRLNLLSCLLTLVMNTSYDFYYFPCISTFWFGMVWATTWMQRKQTFSAKVITTTATACTAHIILLYSNILQWLLEWMAKVHGPNIESGEFMFRLRLDQLMPFCGILFADIERQHAMWQPSHFIKRIVPQTTLPCFSTAALLIFLYITLSIDTSDKFQYNVLHPFISILPIAAYLFSGRAMADAQISVSRVLAALGTNSLELYILQYHIWLANDTKGLLRFGLVDFPSNARLLTPVAQSTTYAIETVFATTIFYTASSMCAKATESIVRTFTNCRTGVLLLRTAFLLLILWLWNFFA